MTYTKLLPSRIANAKRAFTTRRVPTRDMQTLVSGDLKPSAGNLVLATVCELGKHRRIEKPSGRRAMLLPGDEIIVCYGNRYAPDQFEALVSDDLSACDLVAGGGIASREINRHERMLPPTKIAPIGLIGAADGKLLNLFSYRISLDVSMKPISTKVIVVAGTAMNAGKTFTAASVIRGLKVAGYRVAGIKATGTGSGGDLWKMKDMGADVVLDFTDAGFASTYKAPDKAIEAGVIGLINYAAKQKCDFAIVEIADGLQHRETATLLQSSTLKHRAFGCVFAAYDSMGAVAGYKELSELGYSVLAVSGQVTRSPLAMREAAACGCQIYSPFDLQAGALLPVLTGEPAPALPDNLAVQVPSDANGNGVVLDHDFPQLPSSVRFRDFEETHALEFPEDLEETACNFG